MKKQKKLPSKFEPNHQNILIKLWIKVREVNLLAIL